MTKARPVSPRLQAARSVAQNRMDQVRSLEVRASDPNAVVRPEQLARMRDEARVAQNVAHTIETHEARSPYSDFGPLGAGRREIHIDKIHGAQVGRTKAHRGLRGFGNGLIHVAECYADLVEAESSPSPRGDGNGGSGISDGGAMKRLRISEKLRHARQAADGPAIQPGKRLHPDRGQRLIERRVLLDMIAVQGKSYADVLALHGWTRRQEYRVKLREVMRLILRNMFKKMV